MNKYDFIKQGNLLFWHTANNEVECRIISTPEKVDSDSIIRFRLINGLDLPEHIERKK